ncbi:MAG: hypothetical protein H6579_04720 [Chitinophagales bacterium]|nr:hypothetical protein [Bacteroidota bacterium]MCB9256411.1 hypothetical protein [Chitinophagales bacterium]
MRLRVFNTPKPKRFSFHTRYHDENKLSTEEEVRLDKGSFAEYKNKFRSNPFEKEFALKERNRKILVLSIFVGLSALYLFFRGYFYTGMVPGIVTLLLVLFLLKKPVS